MKKKILSFILIICFIFPSIFLTGCDEDSYSLASQTIVAYGMQSIDWESSEMMVSGYYLDADTYENYSLDSMTLEDFLILCNSNYSAAAGHLIDWTGYQYSDVDTLEEQKAIISKKVYNALSFDNMNVVFSNDAANMYLYDKSKTTILSTYSVEVSVSEDSETYTILDGEDTIVKFVMQDEDIIIRQNASSAVFITEYVLPLNASCTATIEAKANDGTYKAVKMYDLFKGKVKITANLIYKIAEA